MQSELSSRVAILLCVLAVEYGGVTAIAIDIEVQYLWPFGVAPAGSPTHPDSVMSSHRLIPSSLLPRLLPKGDAQFYEGQASTTIAVTTTTD